MDKTTVRAIINAAGDNNILVELDNMLLVNTKMKGNIVDFDDDKEVITVLRVNDDITTMMGAPFELFINTYECIQGMSIHANAKDMSAIIDKLSAQIPNKVEDMKKFLATSTASKTYMATPSVNDVTERTGLKPSVYRTDEYVNAGENRSERRNSLEATKTINVAKDGTMTVKVDSKNR